MPIVQDAYDDLSLGEALDAFRRREGLAEKTAEARPEALLHLDRHDVAHVLLGMDTSLEQEGLVDLWTLFGTDARFKDLAAYAGLAEELETVKEIGFWPLIGSSLQALWNAPRAFLRTRRQKKKWPWREYKALLDKRLGDLRAEYGVQNILD